jgi:DNA-binding MarR family transcriptional regulator
MQVSDRKQAEEAEHLVRALYGLGQLRREISRYALAELGTQGFTALGIVHVHGPIRISDVAERLAVDISVASRQLSALIDAGYVDRKSNPDDRRASLVETTDAGHRVLAESHRRMVHGFSQALSEWSADDVTALADGLDRLSSDFAAASASVAGKEARR